MRKYRFELTHNDAVIFSQEGETTAIRTTVEESFYENITASVSFKVRAKKFDLFPSPFQGAVDGAARTQLFNWLLQSTGHFYGAKKGDTGKSPSLGGLGLSWVCTYNGPSPRRPKDVIAAEKAVMAGKRAKREAERAKWRRESEQRTINLRERIKHQVDHAFSLGKHGTEPASKYITCQHCDAPAAVVCLNQPLARGAAVLDEDTIDGALCATHISHGIYGYYSGRHQADVTKVPCEKLEFFYDGIRQIAIKS